MKNCSGIHWESYRNGKDTAPGETLEIRDTRLPRTACPARIGSSRRRMGRRNSDKAPQLFSVIRLLRAPSPSLDWISSIGREKDRRENGERRGSGRVNVKPIRQGAHKTNQLAFIRTSHLLSVPVRPRPV